MASFENLASIDNWAFRPTLADTWLADTIALDTESLTKALQKSFSGVDPETLTSDMISPFMNIAKPDTTPTSTVSGLSGSDQETPAPKRQRNATPGATGKVSKRKSRASKRSQTTFITADAANFRQMVQQVTGVRFGNSQLQMAPILKPEPQRPGSRLQLTGGCLPTLDTSAFLLDHHEQQGVAHTSSAGAGISGPGPLPLAPPVGGVDGVAGFGSGGGIDFDPFPSFPTLESWKVM